MAGMTAEEISIKLNIDISDAEKMRRALTETGKEAHKSFLHGDSAAKGFKKTLHELSDQIPVLGYGLRALISPIGAAFAVAAAGIGYATEKLNEFNKKMDETAAKNAEPISSPKASKWRGIYRVRDAVANNDPSVSGISNKEAKKQAEAVEEWENKKQKAADLVKAREGAVTTAKEEAKAKAEASREVIQTGAGWVDALKYAVGIGPDGKTVAKKQNDDSLAAFRKAREATQALAHAKDAAAKLEGESPHTINRGLWDMLGLKASIGGTARIGAMLSQLSARPTIDDATGGYALRAIVPPGGLAADGGIKYKPIAGAVGFNKHNALKPGELDPNFKADLNQQIAVALMAAFQTGFPVIGKE